MDAKQLAEDLLKKRRGSGSPIDEPIHAKNALTIAEWLLRSSHGSF
jgi:hypothetical protein